MRVPQTELQNLGSSCEADEREIQERYKEILSSRWELGPACLCPCHSAYCQDLLKWMKQLLSVSIKHKGGNAKAQTQEFEGWQVMLGMRQAIIYHQPAQDAAVPQRIGSPKVNDISLEVFSDSTPELKRTRKLARDRKACKVDSEGSNGREGETVTFISDTAEAPQPACCPTLSQAWSAYKAVFCCIVTCGGCFRDCQASISYPYNETLAEEGKRECNGRLPSSPASSSPTEKNGNQTKKSTVGSSFSYPDVKLKGIPVFPNRSPSSHTDTDSCYKETLPEKVSQNSIEKQPLPSSHRSSEDRYSFYEELDLENDEQDSSMSMSSQQIDILIFKKLTELFSVHQIDELAKCTSDTVFLEKTNKISDLINSITQDYHLDEQDAECRLVRGIIRISTRKSRTRPRVTAPTLPSQEENANQGNLPDSGNETMLASVVTSEEDLSVQISMETTADVKARNMRHGAYSAAGSPLSTGSSLQDTETDSSGAPLLKVYC